MRIPAVIAGLLMLAVGAIFVATSASAALVIKINKSAQTLTVTRDGQTLHTWPVSTGKTGHATPSGSFNASRMEAQHFSKEWDDAPMPHSVFFTSQGHAIHGSYEVKRLGSPASHGCVRLAPANAAKLFALVKQQGLSSTRIMLMGSEQVAIANRKASRIAGSARQNERERSAEATPYVYHMQSDSVRQGNGYQPPPFVERQDNLGRLNPNALFFER